MSDPQVKSTSPEKVQLGTFSGVFMPSFLTIMGVIIFLRMGYVVGNAGLWQGVAIVFMANLISILTSLSVSAIATNLRVKGGGDYYLISRSLGLEFGGPIGLVLFLSQAVSVAFYVIGFAEVLTALFPVLESSIIIIESILCVLLFICATMNLDWATKIQSWILFILVLGLLAFSFGALAVFKPELLRQNMGASFEFGTSFWAMFAIFFPAVTGFTQGVSLSGDLKEPEVSIPRGTLMAVLVSFVIYIAFAFLIAGSIGRDVLQYDYMAMKRVSLFPFLIDLGIMSATISSGLTSFLGAPRILQALARDNVFPFFSIFSKGVGPSDTPRNATILTFIVAMICIFNGNLNTIGPIVTMFFLMTYGLMNYATFVEDYGNNPSFRPRFKYFHWRLSLAGAIGCLLAMLFINTLAAVAAFSFVILIYWIVDRTVKETSWGDAKRGFYFSKIKDYLLLLRGEQFHAKNWRPQLLVLSGQPKSKLALVKIGLWLEAGRGILTLANIIPGKLTERLSIRKNEVALLKKFIRENKLPVFGEVLVSTDYVEGVENLVQSHSISEMKPNTIVLGWADQQEKKKQFVQLIQSMGHLEKNIVVVDEAHELFTEDKFTSGKLRDIHIDVWWRGEKNGSLMLLLAYLWTQNPECRRGHIRLLRVVSSEDAREPNEKHLSQLLKAARMDAEIEVVVSKETWTDVIAKTSRQSDVVFVGLGIPEPGGEDAFFKTYQSILDRLPTALLVHSHEKLDVQL